MEVQFRKAVKHGAKLRLAICGPSGSGKTYTLLRLATELGGPMAVVDTERGSASKYADIFDFDVLELDSYDPRRLVEMIDAAAKSGYRVLCIDSLSHFWMGKDGELDLVDRIARRSQSNNSFGAWKQVTPLHNELVDRIIGAPMHVLVSLRAKTEWVLERDEKTGKTVYKRVGKIKVNKDLIWDNRVNIGEEPIAAAAPEVDKDGKPLPPKPVLTSTTFKGGSKFYNGMLIRQIK